MIALLAMASSVSLGQVQDNFSDGDFTANPLWGGSDTKFTISSELLRLNDVAASTAYLSTASAAIHEASWEFYVQMDFNTSGSNFTKVYLVSDQPGFALPLNGYYVSIGGNTVDEIALYRQTGSGSPVKIIDGLDNRINFTTVKAKIKVTRDGSGNWNLYTDTGAAGPTGSYTLEGAINDVTHTTSAYFGMFCTYTISNATDFWFDDFVVTGTVTPDLTPPSVQNVQVISSTSVLVNFSETLESTSAQTTTNFSLNNGIGNPASAVLQADNKSVLLNLSTPLSNGLTHTIQVSGVKDLSGNAMSVSSTDFFYFVPTPVSKKDIIVSEFVADPSPVGGLPESEFIELFNRSVNPVDLQNWKLNDGGLTSATLPQFILMPGAYKVIAPTSTAALFNGAIGVTNFPSLNNTGDNIILKDPNGLTVDSIQYAMTWYHSEDKQDGGWSLEIVDPENLCEEEGNWTASEDPSGGTPGVVNSVLASNPDVTPPEILAAVIESDNQIVVSFNEKLDGNAFVTASLEPTLSVSSVLYSTDLRLLKIITGENLQPSIIYTLTLSNVHDCPGNALVNNTTQLILPEAIAPGDVLLNEILFNPKSGGVDFVEVYNTSSKYLSLKKWSLANMNEDVAENLKMLEGNFIIAPKSFLVFTSDPAILKSHYPRTIETACLTATLPSMNDDEGSIALVDSLNNVLDFFFYKDDYHVAFLKDKEGISLERVSLTSITNDLNNWRSASQQENFATPGYKNSASADASSVAGGEVVIEPEIFSPQIPPNDFTKINYHFSQSGNVANVSIYDQQGHLIKTIANNEVLGVEGFFRWDGDRDDGGRARAGYYVAWVEVFNASGEVNTFRKRIVVSFR
jgi:hypothetical protein